MLVRVALSLVLAGMAIAPLSGQSDTKTAVSESETIDGGTPVYVREETPEERRKRVGEVDPGPNPDPEQIFVRNGVAYRIKRFERRFASYNVPEGYVRPQAFVNFAFELYQHNDKYVWVWMPTRKAMEEFAEKAEKVEEKPKFTEDQVKYVEKLRSEFVELVPAESNVTVRFEESSEGLPQDGSWRHSADFADMNGDGHLDIIAPPQRGARSFRPTIFLGDGTGKWRIWRTTWPYNIDYGTVVAGDFNGDRKPDLAFGIHLQGPRVFLNAGDGRFTDASEGLTDPFPTRRVATADVDADGDLDLLAMYEGPSRGQSLKSAKARAYINDGKANWRAVNAAAESDLLGGDWMAVGTFNGDRYPDFVGSSNYFNGTGTLQRSEGPARWKSVTSDDHFLVPFYSDYGAVATGRFSSRRLDDAIVTYRRFWPDMDPELVAEPAAKQVIGIDRISFSGRQPVRVPVMRSIGSRGISAIKAGDFDGDGKNDLLFTRYDPREAVLLVGDGKGGFRRATIEGLPLLDNPNYDVNVADVNGDGRLDVLVMFESNSESSFGKQNGAIKLFLNRGPVR